MQNKTNQRNYGTYYTENPYIVKYMVSKLNISNDDEILEPSVGVGHFIEEIVKNYNFSHITMYDIDPNVSEILDDKFKKYNVTFYNNDTLTDETLLLEANSINAYSKIIGNPPYGASQSMDKRKLLKKLYPNSYVKETYSLFLELCLRLLKPNGILTFILPDTFMSLNRHKNMREKLLKNFNIKEIVKIPTKVFQTVNFQYSNLVILTIENSYSKNNAFDIIEGISNSEDFKRFVENDNKNIIKTKIKQIDLLKNDDYSFNHSTNVLIKSILNAGHPKLEEFADVVTGFYSGDNKKYMRFLSSSNSSHNRSKLKEISQKEVTYSHKSLTGIETNSPHYIPILKGVSKSYLNEYNYFIKWDKKTITEYKNNKKTRFQNSKYYFNKGIGVPMVKSKKIKATAFNNVIFDQSIVGIFPKNNNYYFYLLGLLNSELINELIHTINHTANNSANYLKKIPIVIPTSIQLKKVNNLVENILLDNDLSKQQEIDKIVKDIYSGY